MRGRDAFQEFLARFTSDSNSTSEQSTKSYYDPIKRQKLITFKSSGTRIKTKTVTEDEKQSFTEILSVFESRKLNLRYIMQWPVTSKPYSICNEGGDSRSSQKSLFRNKLQLLAPVSPSCEIPSDIEVCVVDAMRLVRIIPISNIRPPTFLSWTQQIVKYLENLPGDELHVIFDDYSIDTELIHLSKNRAEKVLDRHISSLNQKLPQISEWPNFLTNRKNKLQITILIANYICENDVLLNKDVYVTKGENCFRKNKNMSAVSITELASNHKEADQRIAYHAIYSSQHNNNVCIVADDSDVYILCLFVAAYCKGIVYFRQGTQAGKQGITYHNITSLARYLGKEVCDILPNFHALTGSDYTNPFYKRSKIQAFKKMISKPDIYPKLLSSLSTHEANLEDVTNFVLYVIYNRPSSEKIPDESRYAMLFKGKKGSRTFNSLHILPPDINSLKMKVMRANYVSFLMSNCLNPRLTYLNPLNYGWKMENDNLVPIWFSGPCLPSNQDLMRESNETDFEIIDNNIKEHENANESDESDEEVFDYLSENNLSSDSDID